MPQQTNMTPSLHGRRFGLDPSNNPIGAGQPYTVTMTAAAGTTNVTEVTMTVVDWEGNTCAAPWVMNIWLSDATTGAGLTATTASGAVAAKASSGADFGTLTSKKALMVQTLATGVYILSITDTAKTAFKVCASVPGSERTVVGITLATANYG